MITEYGWSASLQSAFAQHSAAGYSPGRVVAQHRDGYLVQTDAGERRGKASRRLSNEAPDAGYPVVGDWVAMSLDGADGASTIHAVLPRRTEISRRAADSARTRQVLAANVDVAFVVTSMNGDLNIRRIERFLVVAWQSGARPVVVLTKADLCADPQDQAAQIANAVGCPVLVVSARRGEGLDSLLTQVRSGETCVLIGSSGVGKSTLVNAFLGEERMATQAIRESDDEGRHTTSHRQLVLLSGGVMILDTPGIREVGLVEADEGLSTTFDDVEQLIQNCRFTNCRHTGEPGCAVGDALRSGDLDRGRWESFQKLRLESAVVQENADRSAMNGDRLRAATQLRAYQAKKRDQKNG